MNAALHLLLFLPAVLVVALIAIQLRQNQLRRSKPRRLERLGSLSTEGSAANFRWRLGLLSTLIPLLATAALLKLRWQTIPDRFPIHWGLDGQPNGWANRSLGSTFGPLLLATVLVGSFALLGELTSRSSPGYGGRASMLRTVKSVLLAVCWSLTLLFCAISVLPLTRNPTNYVPLLTMGSLVFVIGILVFIGLRSLRMSETIAASQNTTDDRFWKAGLFYVNPDDSALMVPKRYGFGYTLNFGQPICWFIFAAILLIPVLLPILLH